MSCLLTVTFDVRLTCLINITYLLNDVDDDDDDDDVQTVHT